MPVPTDISGVPNTSPTESPGICSHYVKRGLRTPFLEERLPGDLSTSILHELLFKIKNDSGSLCQALKAHQGEIENHHEPAEAGGPFN
jgi:hypothetical protein